MSETNFNFPDMRLALYAAKTFPELWQLYADQLSSSKEPYNLQYAAKLSGLAKDLTPKHLRSLKKELEYFTKNIQGKSSFKPIVIERRQKSWIDLNSKCRLYTLEGKNLSKIHDMLGFRMILSTPVIVSENRVQNSPESIEHCYEMLNETLLYFSRNGYLLIEAEPRSGNEMLPQDYEKYGIVVPEKNFIIPVYRNCVKDYVRHPKDTGYQALHIYVQTPDGVVFELQIWDLFMQYIATHGPASHITHKKEKYDEQTKIKFDFSKVHIPGFKAFPDGSIIDNVGLQQAVDPFSNLY